MLISVHDSHLHRVGFLDNDKPNATHFSDDTWHRYLAEATSTFDFTVSKTAADAKVLENLTEKNYISFRREGKDYLFNIMKVEETEQEMKLNCENLNLELITEDAAKHDANGAKTYLAYLEQDGINESLAKVSIGVNEIADRKRTLSWDATATKLNRLLSIATGFDAEVEFETELNRDGTLKRLVLNTYIAHDETHQGVGVRRNDVTLCYGKNLDSVRRTIDKTGLYSCIYPMGTDGLNVSNVAREDFDADGHSYFSRKGDAIIRCHDSAEAYPAQLSDLNGDIYTLLRWDYDTKDVNLLYSKALAKLKSVAWPAITYEAKGTEMLDIGDTVTIQDDGFSPTLLLEARVSEQEISFSDPSKNKNTYSNFRALQNKLSKGIQDSSAQLAKDAAEAARLAKEANEKAYAAQVAADAAGAINLIRNSTSCDFDFYSFRPTVLSDASGVILTDTSGAFLSA